MSNAAADIFRRAAALNAADSRRSGNVVHLPTGCDVLAAGDIHGNRTALARIIAHADLAATGGRHLLLQEIIHGPDDEQTGHDRSGEMLLRAAKLKIAHPEQVLFVLGNHDVAQITGNEVIKDGRGLCKRFAAGVRFTFGADGDDVLNAIDKFLLSMPLAVQCPNGVFLTHSLPSPARAEAVETEILQRPYRPEDLHRHGCVYDWTWGRGQSAEQLDRLAEELGVEFFVLGHRHSDEGCELLPARGVTITSNGARGCVLRFSTDEPITAGNVLEHVKQVVAL